MDGFTRLLRSELGQKNKANDKETFYRKWYKDIISFACDK